MLKKMVFSRFPTPERMLENGRGGLKPGDAMLGAGEDESQTQQRC